MPYFAALSCFSAADRDFLPLEGVLGARHAVEAEYPGCSVEAEEEPGYFLVTLSPELQAQLDRDGYIDESRGGLRLQIDLP